MTQMSRPEPFSAYTAPELWNDPHIAQRMLAEHLDPNAPMASRAHTFIDQSVDWLMFALNLRAGCRVLDLGCGPGLYAQRLARRGIGVRGIDVSETSVTYAREEAQRDALPISVRRGDYLHDDLGSEHDAALLIYEDYCALSPEQRALLLGRVREALKAGGQFLFDVASATRFRYIREAHREEENLMDGFWSDEAYVGEQHTWTYPERRLVLDRYVIRTSTSVREYWNWMHCLSVGEVADEVAAAGFEKPQFYGDVAGAAFDVQAETFAVLAARDDRAF